MVVLTDFTEVLIIKSDQTICADWFIFRVFIVDNNNIDARAVFIS